MNSMVRLSPIRLMILEFCNEPKSWSEIIYITGRSKPTILNHLNVLQFNNLLTKTNLKYKTNFKNKEAIKTAKQIIHLENKLEKLLYKSNGELKKWNEITIN